MKDNKIFELKNVSHIMLVIAVVISSVVLSVRDYHNKWDDWMIPLFMIAAVSCIIIHIAAVLPEKVRIDIYTIIVLIELFYLFMHSLSPYEGIPVVMLFLAMLALTQDLKLVWVCIFSGIFSVSMRFITDVRKTGINDYIYFLWNVSLLLMAGIIATRIVRVLGELRQYYERRVFDLQEETGRADIFMSSISEEIKSPIDKIIKLADNSLNYDIAPEVKDNLKEITFIGKAAQEQIGDVLDYSELEMNKAGLNIEEYEMSSVLSGLVPELRKYKNNKTELVIDVDPGLPKKMKTDVPKLTRILWHVIVNGLKYTGNGGVYVHISYTPQDYGINLIIDVNDTGAGMNEEELERVYERFYRSDEKRKLSSGGLGLGMPVVLGYVRLLNGFITINSRVEEGTRVHICIPQEVTDKTRCMALKNADTLRIAGFLQFEKYPDPCVREFYNMMMGNMLTGLGLTLHRVNSMEELEEVNKRYSLTHIFVGEEQYTDNKERLEELSSSLKLVLVCNDDFYVPGHSGVGLLKKPIYCFPIIDILSGKDEYGMGIQNAVFNDDSFALKDETPQSDGNGQADISTGDTGDDIFKQLDDSGIDTAMGLEWCLNDRELYEGILIEYASDAPNKLNEMEEYYEKEDMEEFTVRVHSIKSSSKMIGDTKISGMAEELEDAAKHRDVLTVKEKYPVFLSAYKETVKLIGRLYNVGIKE